MYVLASMWKFHCCVEINNIIYGLTLGLSGREGKLSGDFANSNPIGVHCHDNINVHVHVLQFVINTVAL